ncbi:MAG: hypothetical protein JSW08_03420 [archaeon]|nr:MAG: hypothetical protein JSW08_03420 [archaeon]
MRAKQIISLIIVIILVLNMIFIGFKIISPLLFLIILIIAAIIAFWIMPKVKG